MLILEEFIAIVVVTTVLAFAGYSVYLKFTKNK